MPLSAELLFCGIKMVVHNDRLMGKIIIKFVEKKVSNPLTKAEKRYKLYLALKNNEC